MPRRARGGDHGPVRSFAKFDVTGPGAEAMLDRLIANRLPGKLDGIGLTQVLSDNGRILGEWTITRLG